MNLFDDIVAVISDYLKHLDAESPDRENTESEFSI